VSRLIAPGAWDPILRVLAKNWTKVIGVGLIIASVWIGWDATGKVLEIVRDSDREVTKWLILLTMAPAIVPFGLGAVMAMPDVFTPVVYRFLARKKAGTGTGTGNGG